MGLKSRTTTKEATGKVEFDDGSTNYDEATDGQLEEQAEKTTTCPECGEEPDGTADHELVKTGFLRDRQLYQCENGHTWTHSVPIAKEGDERGNVTCENESCECEFCRVSELHVNMQEMFNAVRKAGSEDFQEVKQFIDPDKVLQATLICPECKYERTETLHVNINRMSSIVGFPDITGSTTGAT